MPKTKRYTVPGKEPGRRVAELLSTGTQSLVPPSLHESGEVRRWYAQRPAHEIDGAELGRRVCDVATAALLVRNWPGQGGRHDYVLAATGYLARKLPPERAERIMRAAVVESGDEEPDGRFRDVSDTLEKAARGEPTTGGPMLDQLAPGTTDVLRRWQGWGSEPLGTEAAGGMPTIVVNDRPLRDVGDEALEALEASNTPAALFARAGKIIRLGQDENDAPIIQEASESVTRHHLTRAANFIHRQNRKSGPQDMHVDPSRSVVQDVLSVPHLPFPPLIGVPRTPFFRPDGTIVSTPGYDAATRLYYVPAHEGFAVKVPKKPSDDDLRDAVKLLDEAVGDLPYVDEASAANTLALLLTPIMRNVIPGPVPLALIDKPTPGTGGSLLAEVVSLVATGTPAGMMSAPRDDEEVRKQITSALMRGNLVVTLDNVDGVLSAPSLSRALTSEFWEDRILGRSEMIRVPQRATWLASGNNLQVGGDLPRRGYWIRLDAREERPWERSGFRHPHLKAWVAENRAGLVSALLALGRAWFVEGKLVPEGAPTLGGFEGWSRTIGGVLESAGVKGFLGNLNEMYERAADGTNEWGVFLASWREAYGDSPKKTKEVAADLHNEEYVKLRGTLPEELGDVDPERQDKGLSKKLGKAFAKREGRRHGPERLHLERAGSKQNATQWTVRSDPGAPPETVSLVSSSHPPPSAHTRAHTHTRENRPEQTNETNQTNAVGATSGSEAPTSGSDVADVNPPLSEDEIREIKRLVSKGFGSGPALQEVLLRRRKRTRR